MPGPRPRRPRRPRRRPRIPRLPRIPRPTEVPGRITSDSNIGSPTQGKYAATDEGSEAGSKGGTTEGPGTTSSLSDDHDYNRPPVEDYYDSHEVSEENRLTSNEGPETLPGAWTAEESREVSDDLGSLNDYWSSDSSSGAESHEVTTKKCVLDVHAREWVCE